MTFTARTAMTTGLIIFAASTGLAAADPSVRTEPPAAGPPASIEFDGTVYVHDKAWKADEIRIETNLDDDPEPEIFIGFIGSWKPETPAPEAPGDPLAFVKREIPVIEHRVFYQILDPLSEGRTRVVKMWTGMDQIGSARILTLDPQGPPALLVISPGGQHYNEVRIVRWKEGGYPFLLNESANTPVQVDETSGRVRIVLGDRSWTWNGEELRKN